MDATRIGAAIAVPMCGGFLYPYASTGEGGAWGVQQYGGTSMNFNLDDWNVAIVLIPLQPYRSSRSPGIPGTALAQRCHDQEHGFRRYLSIDHKSLGTHRDDYTRLHI